MLDRLAILALSPLALALSPASTWLTNAQNNALAPNQTGAASIGLNSETGATFRSSQDGMYRTIVHINSKPIEMIVDTGATRSVLSRAAASALGVRVQDKSSGLIRTFSGTVPLVLAEIDNLQIADRRFSHVQAAIIDDSDISVVGLDWLTKLGPIRLEGTF